MKLFKNRDSAGSQERGWSLIEALAAIVVFGIGVMVFVKVQKMSSQQSRTNSKMLMAGKMIEKLLEDTRISVSMDTLANWPPTNKSLSPVPPDNITLVSTVSDALSPEDNAIVNNVVRLDIMATWMYPVKDSLMVTTYVSKRF